MFRTSSKSTFEGNVYVDYRKYCYEEDIRSYEQADQLLNEFLMIHLILSLVTKDSLVGILVINNALMI